MTTTVMRASQEQRARTKAEEGLRLTAYNDTVGVSTIGWGHASVNPHPVRGLLNGEFYQGKPKKGVTITLQEAERLFDLDIDEIEVGASALIKHELSQPQFDAVIDFLFQYGLEKFRTSDLLAALNFNPNGLEAVFYQFMRWTRAGGDHQEYVWRRSARRCCIYNGSPIPQALWRKNGFPFAITADDKVDYTITPSIEKIIAYGKKAAEKPVFPPPPLDLTAEAKIDGVEATKPIEAAPEPAVPDVAGGAPQVTSPPAAPPAAEPYPSPATESVASPDGSGTSVAITLEPASEREGVGGPLPPVSPASVEMPNTPAEPDAQPVKKKDTMGTIAKDAGLDRSSVEKAITAWLVWLGNSLRSLGANGMKIFGLSGSSLSVIADQLQQPFVQIMVATAFFVCLTGGIWFVGVITEKGALKVKVKAERAEAAT